MIIKCKMCGGDLNIQEGNPICECEFCGTQQTIPVADNEKKVNLFNRANRLRMNAEFDKAATVYASITAEFPEEAEAYWGLCLSKYGIEYVDDPLTGNKIPTCHRTLTTSIMDDSDFDQACEYADPESKRLYREEAKAIDRLQQDILSIVASEEPFDVFICYKETDNDGNRTEDSVLAQDIYDSLTSKGLKVFFARITLEDKLGKQYEPYIYAALHSAKVMLAVGTQFDYFDAVWVKNEWARYLDMMKTDKSKTLIPCFKGIDAYDMPREFKNLQAQNISKLGWLQDLTRGVEKLLNQNEDEKRDKHSESSKESDNMQLTASIKRGYLALEDQDWKAARKYFDTALNYDAECADAYLGLVLAEMKISTQESFQQIRHLSIIDIIEQNSSFKKYERFASEEQKKTVNAVLRQVREQISGSMNQPVQPIESARNRILPAKGMLYISPMYIAGVKTDGTVCVRKHSDGTDIKMPEQFYGVTAVSSTGGGTDDNNAQCLMVLRADGTVVTGPSEKLQENREIIESWKDIKQIKGAGGFDAFAVKKYGNVLSTKERIDWYDIVSIDCNCDLIVGLRTDGTVLAMSRRKGPVVYECIKKWKDIVELTTDGKYVFGLKKNGTIIIDKLNEGTAYYDKAENWRGIISICCDGKHLFGLTIEGTVIMTPGEEKPGDKKLPDEVLPGWIDIVAIDSCGGWVAGIKADGTVLKRNMESEKNETVPGWKLFDSIETVEQERNQKMPETTKKKKEKVIIDKENTELKTKKEALKEELNRLSGLFAGKRRKEIWDQLRTIENRIRELENRTKELQ